MATGYVKKQLFEKLKFRKIKERDREKLFVKMPFLLSWGTTPSFLDKQAPWPPSHR